MSPRMAPAALDLPAPDMRDGTMMDVNGASLFVTDTGGMGEPLLLLHGYPLSGALFSRVVDELDDSYRVITVDHRGYGKSTTPSTVRNVGTYSDDALAVLRRMNVDKAHIAGMSMGGPIMFDMYRKQPSRFASMILIDTNAKAANGIEKGIWQGARAMLNETGDVSSIIPVLMPDMLSGDTRLNQPAQADYLTRAIKQSSLQGALGGTYVLENRPDSMDTLRSVRVPALLIVGVEDSLYPVELNKQMADALPNSTLVKVPGSAHAAVFESPDVVADAMLEFLDDVD